jgi:hypothetical protein
VDRWRRLVAAVLAVGVATLSTAANHVTGADLPYLVAVAIALAAAFHIARYLAVPDLSHDRQQGCQVRGHALYLMLAVVGVVVALSPAAVAGARWGRPGVAPKVGGKGQLVQFDAGRVRLESTGLPQPGAG